MKASTSQTVPQLLATAYLPEQLISPEGYQVLFLGRSNAGKSTLLNSLLKKAMAKVSKTPGKTRSVNYYRWGRLTLVDLPGFGYARLSQEERVQWEPLMREFFDRLLGRALALILVDSRRQLGEEEWKLTKSLLEREVRVRFLLTKSDQLNQSERALCRRGWESLIFEKGFENILNFDFVSAKTGEGVDGVRRLIFKYGQEAKT